MYATRDENRIAQIKLQTPEEALLADEVIEHVEADTRASVREWHPRCESCKHYHDTDGEWCYKPGGRGPTTNFRYCSDHTELTKGAPDEPA